MRKNLTIVLFLLQTITSFGQFAGKKFVYEEERLVFINDSLIDFTFINNGCLFRVSRGIGKYKIINNQLSIQTFLQDTLPAYKILQNEKANNSDSIKVYLKFAKNLNPIRETQIYLLDSTMSLLDEGVSDKKGMFSLRIKERIKFLNFDDYNGDGVNVPINEISGSNSTIVVRSHRILKNDELLFNIEETGNSICLTGPLPLPKDRKKYAIFNRKMKLNIITHSWPWNWRFKPNHIHDPKRHCLLETNN